MLKTIEVEIDRHGQIRPVDALRRLPPGRALLTLLSPSADETALLAEAALAEDWLRPEEDEAWADLPPGASAFVLGAMLMDAQDLLGRRVDIVTRSALNPALRERVLLEAQRL